MEARYNVTGEKRKELVAIAAKVTGITPVYTRVPKCSYMVGDIEISKDGTLIWDEKTDVRVIVKMMQAAVDAGFVTSARMPEIPAEDMPGDAVRAEEQGSVGKNAAADAPEEVDIPEQEYRNTAAADEPVGLTVTVPLDAVSVENLTKILEAKGSLIKKALGIDALPVEVGDTAVSFPWFSEAPEADESKAYTDLISALCKMSREQKRITATEKAVDNEKYAFRCFLLRLGFIGEEYKTDRKVLLKNLTGSSAFKSGHRKEAGGNA